MLLGLFLKALSSGGESVKGWELLFTPGDVIRVVLLITIAGSAALSLFLRGIALPITLLVASGIAFGLSYGFAYDVDWNASRSVGLYLALVGTLLSLGGSIAVLMDQLSPVGQQPVARPQAFQPPLGAGVASPQERTVVAQQSPPPAAEAQTVPAGWYDDPTGQARQRYWSGTEWTENTR